MSDMDRAIIYEDENKRNPLKRIPQYLGAEYTAMRAQEMALKAEGKYVESYTIAFFTMESMKRHFADKILSACEEAIASQAMSDGLLAYQISTMSQDNLYWLLNKAVQGNADFRQHVLNFLGDDEEGHFFLWLRDQVVQIVRDHEVSGLPDFVIEERREFAKMQALAGWHHVH